MTILITIIALGVLFGLFLMSTYNKLIKSKNYVEESFSTIDTYLKRRYDLIPNLVETVKGAKNYESETLERVIRARNSYLSASTPEEKISNEKQVAGFLGKLFALQESYPDLKVNKSFVTLQTELSKIEEDILQARKYYNGCVRNYNVSCETFPSNIVAGMFNFKKYSFFTIENQEEKKNVKVSF